MNDRFPELDQLRIEVSDDTRALHMSAVEGEIRSWPGHSEGRRAWSRRVAAAAVILAVLLPAAAIASEGSVPGDFLYPIKQAVEPIRMILDPQVEARHRIEELEVLVDMPAEDETIDRQVDRARDALAETEAPDLQRRLDRIVDLRLDRPNGGAPPADPLPNGSADTRDSTTTTQRGSSDEADPSSDTTAPAPDEPTSTTVPSDSDGAPPSDRPPTDG